MRLYAYINCSAFHQGHPTSIKYVKASEPINLKDHYRLPELDEEITSVILENGEELGYKRSKND